jgi:hypothetical protein
MIKEYGIVDKNLPQCHIVHYKSHITWPGIELWLTQWEASA